MKFGPVPVAEALGAIAAHALRLEGLTLKKGHVIDAQDQAVLLAAGIESIVAARVEPGDIGEDEAARELAAHVAGAHVRCERAFTGRVNMFAEVNGLLVVGADAIDAINRIDEAVTVATLAQHRPVTAGDMAATVKIIPFAAPAAAMAAARAVPRSQGAVAIAPYRPLRIGVVSTLLPALKSSVVAKTLRVLEDITLDDWRQCLSVNLDGAFLCAREATRFLRKQGSGSIVNMSSTAGLYGFPRRAPYAAAKWAIRGLTKTMAQELGPSGVRVNCICPGSVEGERMDRVIAAEASKTGQSEAQVRKLFTEAASLRTFVSADDIANAILFITSPQGARISGQELVVDGHTETL